MLFIRVSGIPHAQLERLVARHCSQFGSVTSARIVPSPDNGDVALVTMSDPEDTKRLLINVGDAQNGHVVVIRLMQRSLPQSRETKTQRLAA